MCHMMFFSFYRCDYPGTRHYLADSLTPLAFPVSNTITLHSSTAEGKTALFKNMGEASQILTHICTTIYEAITFIILKF